MCGKRLLQKSRTARVHGLSSDFHRVKRSHEDHWGRRTLRLQPTLHLNAGYAAHVDVEDNARHIARAIAVKKCLGGTENFCGKVRRVQYPLEPPQDAGFVINDRDSSFCRQITQPKTITRTAIDCFSAGNSPYDIVLRCNINSPRPQQHRDPQKDTGAAVLRLLR